MYIIEYYHTMIRKVTKTLWYAVDIDGSGWLHEDKPTREYTYMEWRCDNLHHCPEDLMLDRSIFLLLLGKMNLLNLK